MSSITPCYALARDLSLRVPMRQVTGFDAVITRCLLRLATVTGSVLSDRTIGCVDFDEAISTGSRYTGETYRAAIREQLLAVQGVLSVSPVTGDGSSMTVTVTCSDGTVTAEYTLVAQDTGPASNLLWSLS